MIKLNNGKFSDTVFDLSFMMLQNCHEVLKIDWIIPDSNDAHQNFLWILYKTTYNLSSISIIKLEAKEKMMECDLYYTIMFDEYIADADCIGILSKKGNKLAMISTITNNEDNTTDISFYNIPLNLLKGYHKNIKLKKPIKSFNLQKELVKLAWNYNNPIQMAVSDKEYNLYLVDIEKNAIILQYHKAHKMRITKIIWINNLIGTSSYDGNIKFWDLEDYFSPSLVHSIGQRWIYDIEWDPLLNVLHYNSEGKGNSYSYLTFYGVQAPVLKKYVIPSQATLVLIFKEYRQHLSLHNYPK